MCIFLACPGTPSNFHVASVTPTSVTLAWTAPTDDGGAKIKKYFIERQDATGEFIPCDSTSGSTTETLIKHLKEQESYNFRIFSSNSAGKCETPATLQDAVVTTAKTST